MEINYANILAGLSCPKCNGKRIKSKKQGKRYRVRCKDCHITTHYKATEFQAIMAWQNNEIIESNKGLC